MKRYAEPPSQDVYDLAAECWCHLCEMPHWPCELDDDGIEHICP